MTTKNSPEGNRSRQQAYRENMKDQGYAQTGVWVPEHLLGEIRRIAESMRDDPDAAWMKRPGKKQLPLVQTEGPNT